jgi:hypothetical protein
MKKNIYKLFQLFPPPLWGKGFCLAKLKQGIICLLFLAAVIAPSVFGEEKSGDRDPFKSKLPVVAAKPIQTAGPSRPVMANLEGLSIGPKGSTAIIGGEVYKEGEEKKGIKVVKIRRQEADIIINGMPNTLRMMIPGEAEGVVQRQAIVSAPVPNTKEGCGPLGDCL